jgi:hypothetical protein
MRHLIGTSIALYALLLAGGTARGAEAEVTARAEPTVSVTISPVHLILPIVELTGELRLREQVSAAVILGGGRRDVENFPATQLNAGVQGRWYALGTFRHGLQVGGELLYEHVAVHDTPPTTIVVAGGLGIGPFVGYKIATRSGFTFDGQLGARYMVTVGRITGEEPLPGDVDRWLPLLNLNVGWSF